MYVKPCGSAPKACKEVKLYTWDELKKQEGVYRSVSSGVTGSSRIIVLGDMGIQNAVLFYSGHMLAPASSVAWKGYKFEKMDEQVYMEVK